MQKVYKAALPTMYSQMDFVKSNLGDMSEEHGERFQQDVQAMEKRYKGRRDAAMMDDYIWCLIRDDDKIHKKAPRSSVHFSLVSKLFALTVCLLCIRQIHLNDF